jgi:hypothetical protein
MNDASDRPTTSAPEERSESVDVRAEAYAFGLKVGALAARIRGSVEELVTGIREGGKS